MTHKGKERIAIIKVTTHTFASKALEQIEEFALYFNDNALRDDAVKLRHDILDSVQKLGTTLDKSWCFKLNIKNKAVFLDMQESEYIYSNALWACVFKSSSLEIL